MCKLLDSSKLIPSGIRANQWHEQHVRTFEWSRIGICEFSDFGLLPRRAEPLGHKRKSRLHCQYIILGTRFVFGKVMNSRIRLLKVGIIAGDNDWHSSTEFGERMLAAASSIPFSCAEARGGYAGWGVIHHCSW